MFLAQGQKNLQYGFGTFLSNRCVSLKNLIGKWIMRRVDFKGLLAHRFQWERFFAAWLLGNKHQKDEIEQLWKPESAGTEGSQTTASKLLREDKRSWTAENIVRQLLKGKHFSFTFSFSKTDYTEEFELFSLRDSFSQSDLWIRLCNLSDWLNGDFHWH